MRCNIEADAAGEIWHWSLSGVKGLRGGYSDPAEIRFSAVRSPQLWVTATARNDEVKVSFDSLSSHSLDLAKNSIFGFDT